METVFNILTSLNVFYGLMAASLFGLLLGLFSVLATIIGYSERDEELYYGHFIVLGSLILFCVAAMAAKLFGAS